ncbi:hypothetical protein GCM10009838_35280 [Catenulispora subtropica]|uniref:Uncharacterized protein n=1 Tax=Catenulispora subtropica TaxID=450798 RepID=A0ABP5D1J0_9ACTN
MFWRAMSAATWPAPLPPSTSFQVPEGISVAVHLVPAAWVGAAPGEEAGALEVVLPGLAGVEDVGEPGVPVAPAVPVVSEALVLPTDVVEPCDPGAFLLAALEHPAAKATAARAPATVNAEIRFMRPTFPGDDVR